MPTPIDVSVITPCRNEASHIGDFLASLENLNRDGLNVEFIVADGMSDDGTRPLLKTWAERGEGHVIIDNPGRIVSTGLNAAIQKARGEFVIRMDAHTVYDRNYIVECVQVLRSTDAKCVGGPWKAEGYDFVSRCVADAFQSRLGSGNSSSRKTGFSGYVDTVYLPGNALIC
jgi:succinoglycan biosynthesis protein ExoA